MTYARLTELTAKDDGKEVAVAGWAEDVRNLGGIAFVILRQREGTLQLAVRKKERPEVFEAVASLTRESVIAAKGVLKANPQARNGWEIFPAQLDVLSKAETPLPLGVQVRGEPVHQVRRVCEPVPLQEAEGHGAEVPRWRAVAGHLDAERL